MTQIPIIKAATAQKLIITFDSNDKGMGEIKFGFEPEFEIAETPEQIAAANVAHQIVSMLKLEAQGDASVEPKPN